MYDGYVYIFGVSVGAWRHVETGVLYTKASQSMYKRKEMARE